MKKTSACQTEMLGRVIALLLAIWLLCGYAIVKAADDEWGALAPSESVGAMEDDASAAALWVDPAEQDEPIVAPPTPPETYGDAKDERAPEPEEAATPQVEWVYIRVNGATLYPSKSMKSGREVGTVTGIALALDYMEDNQDEAIRAIFVTGDGVLHDGVFAAHAVQALDYQEAIQQIGGDVCRCFADNNAWPLPGAAFVPAERGQASKPTEEAAPAPYVIITGNAQGELIAGVSVVLTAEVFHLDEGRIAGYRWLRVVGGELQEVPGVAGNVCTFLASEENSACEYIVEVLLH